MDGIDAPRPDPATLRQSALQLCNWLVQLHATLPADKFEQICAHLARCNGPAWDVCVPAAQIAASAGGSELLTPAARAATEQLNTPPPPRRTDRRVTKSSPRLRLDDSLEGVAAAAAALSHHGSSQSFPSTAHAADGAASPGRGGKRKRTDDAPARLRSPLIPLSHAAAPSSSAAGSSAAAAFSPSEESGAFALLELFGAQGS